VTVPPLLRFVLAGAVLFGAEQLVTAPPDGPGEPTVALSPAMQQLILGEVRDRLGRPPNAQETSDALRSWEEESLLVADARALGLDQGDPIVRRRLAKKMRYLIEDATPPRAPTRADLEAHLTAHPDRFQIPARLAFEHRFFDRGARGAALDTDARQGLQALRSGQDVAGDPHRVSPTVPLQTKRQVAEALGAPFARAVMDAPQGEWSGPFPSARGLHLVRIARLEASRTALLDEMTERIEVGWRRAQRKAAYRRQLDRLRVRHGLPPRGQR